MKAEERLLHHMAQSTPIAKLTVAELNQLIIQAISHERERYEKRFAFLQRQISMLRANDRHHAAKELHDATIQDGR